jgi:hypothetical protein
VRGILGLAVLASGLAGALSYPAKNLIVAEAVSSLEAESDSAAQFRNTAVKGDREQVRQVPFVHTVRVSYFHPRPVLDNETLRLSLNPERDRYGDDAAADPISHKRDVRVADLSGGMDSSPLAEPTLTKEELCNTLSEQAQVNELPAIYFANLIWQESRFQHDAVSPVGALGVAQFMPEVAEESGVDDPFDPLQAIPASARLLRDLRDEFGNLGLAAAAYNAGPGRVRDWLKKRRKLPRETRDYVMRVTGWPVEHWRAAKVEPLPFAPARRLPCRDMPVFAELQQHTDAKQDDTGPIVSRVATTTRSHLNLHRKRHAARVALKQRTAIGKDKRRVNKASAQKVAHKASVTKHGTHVGATPTTARQKKNAKKDIRKPRKSRHVRLAAKS